MLYNKLAPKKYRIIFQEHKEENDIKREITQLVLLEKCDFLVMGSFGVKGP